MTSDDIVGGHATGGASPSEPATSSSAGSSPWVKIEAQIVEANRRRLLIIAAFAVISSPIFMVLDPSGLASLDDAMTGQVGPVIRGARWLILVANALCLAWLALTARRRRRSVSGDARGVTFFIAVELIGFGLLIGSWEVVQPVVAWHATAVVCIAVFFSMTPLQALAAFASGWGALALTMVGWDPHADFLASKLVTTGAMTALAFVVALLVRRQVVRGLVARVTIEAQRGELAEANDDLETAIARAQELAQRARSADVAKSDFLASMSHEIRTPMFGILGTAELALQSAESAQQREQLETVRDSALGLMQLLDNILDLRKIESRRVVLNVQAVTPAVVLAEALAPLEAVARRKGLALQVEHGSGLHVSVLVDPMRLRQIVTNIVGNALKFTAQGSVVVKLSAQPLAEDRAELLLSVRDTGQGIPADQLQRIFEPFEQLAGADGASRELGGVGLGLSICRELTRLMGGRIWAESTVGGGAALFVSLPVVLAGTEVAAAAADAVDAPLPKGLRVLVAEDNPVNQRLILRFLEHAGCEVRLAADGTTALETLRAGGLDAALVDVQMPGLDGMEVARQLRITERETGARRLPLIAVTAHAMKGDRERLLEAGLDDHLAKPFEGAELRRVLARACAAAQTAEGVAAASAAPAAPEAVSGEASPAPDSAER